jgi:hypothetical protein
MTAGFLNVDLTLRGSKANELVGALAPGAFLVSSDGDRVTLELASGPESIDEAIGAFAAIVEALPETARRAWDECEVRAFDIGLRAQRNQLALSVSSESLVLLTKVRGVLGVVVYPNEEA